MYNNNIVLECTAVTAAKVWALDRRVFQQVMKKTGLQRIDDNVKFLRSVPLLERLTTDHMSKIADALEVVRIYISILFSIYPRRRRDLFSILRENEKKEEACEYCSGVWQEH